MVAPEENPVIFWGHAPFGAAAPSGPTFRGAAYFGRRATPWQTLQTHCRNPGAGVGQRRVHLIPEAAIRPEPVAGYPSPDEKAAASLDRFEYGVIVHYNTTSSSTSLEAVMSSRLVPILLMTAMLYALGASISSLPRHSTAAPKFDAGVTTTADAAMTDAVLLPTVTVRPDALSALVPETTLLPTITVRPSAEEIAAARALDAKAVGTGVIVVALHAAGGGMMPRSGLDMPYYSFGKSVYRLRKE
jgi:hypothetical protein